MTTSIGLAFFSWLTPTRAPFTILVVLRSMSFAMFFAPLLLHRQPSPLTEVAPTAPTLKVVQRNNRRSDPHIGEGIGVAMGDSKGARYSSIMNYCVADLLCGFRAQPYNVVLVKFTSDMLLASSW